MTDRLDIEELMPLLQRAREEDLGGGDVTSEAVIPADAVAVGTFIAKAPGVAAGMALLAPLASIYDERLAIEAKVKDGGTLAAGDVMAEVRGPARGMLAFERVALNFLQRLSGIATLTRAFVQAVAGTRAKILDTRKTTPGLRALEKYAVRCGGGTSHRVGLFDAVLLKDNHIALAGGDADLAWAACRLREAHPRMLIEVEVDTLEQFGLLLSGAPKAVDVVLLDNMTPAQMADAVQMRDELSRRPESAGPGLPLLEASGGVTLATVAAIAATGVERISIGALTHSATALDIGLDIQPAANVE
ncbi:MAG: putative nicotinate-nucleotide pyrophosphorylase [carboxylating] [Phycisphaerae bacterium]|nr:putative nicotinate-nucleotide pyrophosphorylase [carboxylating] [Phycisphaerae bacterium]